MAKGDDLTLDQIKDMLDKANRPRLLVFHFHHVSAPETI